MKQQAISKKQTKKRIESQGWFDKTNDFFERHKKLFVILSMIASFLMSILLFDVKVSLSGDDCDYIIAAKNFFNTFAYPGHHGPLYPVILSPFVGLFGLKILLLKFLSVIFIVAAMWFFYKSFERFVPAIILMPSLLIVGINPHVFFFASYTYSEPLFMLCQALFFYVFTGYFLSGEHNYSLRQDWKKYILTALAIMAMGLTRTLCFGVIGVIILYFVIERKWKDLLYLSGAIVVVLGLFYSLKPVIWTNPASVMSFESLIAKNAFNPELGMEDFAGLTQRFLDNSNIFLSGYLYKYMGFRSSSDAPFVNIPILAILSYILFATSLASVFKKNKPLLFVGLYLGVMFFLTFILLSKIWAQDRFLMIFYPLILMFLLAGLYYLVKNSLRWIYIVAFGMVLLCTGIHAVTKIGEKAPILQQNMMGNDLYGLTPDWENFIKMSRWVDKNLPKDAVVVSRKPSISYIYTGREFNAIMNVPSQSLDEVSQEVKANSDNFVYVIVDGANEISDLKPYIYTIFQPKQGGEGVHIDTTAVTFAIMYKIEKSEFYSEIDSGNFKGTLTDMFRSQGIKYTIDFDGFIKQLYESKTALFQINNPDLLLANIKQARMQYFLLPKIRLYTYHNTGMYVNTIHKYIQIISMKYPGKFILIHTIGKDETCELAEYTGGY